MMTSFKWMISVSFLVGLMAFGAHAATFTVTKIADTNDGVCDVDCSLREAIAAANGSPADDVIEFSPTVFATAQTITLGGTELAIDNNGTLTINGTGANLLSISGNNASRVFYVNGANLALNGLSVINGRRTNEPGGGILSNNGTLNLTNSTVSGNSVSGFSLFGGGIVNNNGTVNVTNSTVSNNRAEGMAQFGGIANNGGTLNVTNSTVSDNSSEGLGGGGINNSVGGTVNVTNSTVSSNWANFNGAGIRNNGGTVNVTNSTFSSNHVNVGGAGIFNNNGGTVNVTNTTISGNTTNGSGGGIFNNSTLNVTNSTFSGNTANGSGGGITNDGGTANLTNSTVSGNSSIGFSHFGGGVSNSGGTFNAGNSIIAGNSAMFGPDFNGTLTSQGYNLIGNTSGTNIIGDTTGNIYGVDPQLGSLADNGGPTRTRALLSGSPAINAGSNALAVDPANQALTNDQRGAGFLRIKDGTVDMGSFESTTALSLVVDTTSDDGNLSACATAANDCSLRGAISQANTAITDDTITFDPAVFSTAQTITLGGSQLSIANSGTLIINGTGARLLTLNGNNASRLILVNQNATLEIGGFTFSNGNAPDYGGGLQNIHGTMTVRDSVIVNSRATVDGGGISGNGATTLTNCTIRGNTATNGGGIELGQGGSLTMTNVTVSGNTATDGSGGLLSRDTTTIRNSTITGNTANGGGGINQQNGSVISLLNTIVAGNFAASSPDFSGTIASQGFNLIGNTGGTTITGTTTGNILNQDAKLLPLGNNGGTTQTHALLPESPAINAGTATGTPPLDQRGKARIGNPDIGAFEAGANLVVTNTLNAGMGSLRDAVSFANGTTDDESITFNIPSNDAGCVAGACTIILTSGELGINNDGGLLVISNTTGAGNLRVSGNNASRVFYVNGANLALNGLSVINGRVTNDNGGGIFNNNGGTVNLTNSTVSSNSTNFNGGGIFNNPGGTVNVTNSTVSGNSAEVGGGGILNSGTMTVTNSTVSGNLAGFDSVSSGGGIFNSGGTMTVTNSTVTGNSAARFPSTSSGGSTTGGGIVNGGGTFNARNSIIAGNSATDSAPDFDGTLTSQGFNLIGNTSGTAINGDTTGNILNQNARLAPLGFYGGQTRTHALLSGSPALNGGTSVNAPTLDQRGAARIGATDIGAFELNSSSNGGTFVATLPDGQVSVGYNFTLIPEAGSTSYCISSGTLPPGMSGLTNCPPTLNENNDAADFVPNAAIVLGGTPTQGGLFNFAVTAMNGGDSNVTNYTVNIFAPTAAGVSVAGRVLTSNGSGVTNAIVLITDQSGNRRSVRTGSFGYFRFDDVASGEVHVIEVNAKRFRFLPQVIVPIDEVTELTFIESF